MLFLALTLGPFVLFLCPAMGGSVLATVALPVENGTKLAQPGCPIHFGKECMKLKFDIKIPN